LVRVSTMSPRTVQHRHPLLSNTTSSLDRSTSKWSRPISPNSLTMTAVAAISGCFKTWFSTVVLPLPRNPVSSVTGVRENASSTAIRLGFSDLGSGQSRPQEQQDPANQGPAEQDIEQNDRAPA